MSEAQALKEAGLERCSYCKRILRPKHLLRGRCRDWSDCAISRMISEGADDAEFVRGLELGREQADASRSSL